MLINPVVPPAVAFADELYARATEFELIFKYAGFAPLSIAGLVVGNK